MSRIAWLNLRRRSNSQLIIVAIIIAAALLQPRIESWFAETFPQTTPSGQASTEDLQTVDSDRSPPVHESAASAGQSLGSDGTAPGPDHSVLADVADSRFKKNTSATSIADAPHRESERNRTGSRESGDEPPPGKLTLVSRDIFRSTAGLVYRPGSREGHRLKHILTHAKDNLDKPVHGVFAGDREEILRWIDVAFIEAGQLSSDVRKRQEYQRVEWTVNMREEIGYVGGYKGRRKACRYLRLVIEGDGETVVTAYPTSSF
jgi:hypothetical protein